MAAASPTRGQWLRDQRQARGWNVQHMRRQLREAAEAAGDELPGDDILSVMIHRWEDNRSGISERYKLHYCRAFGVPLGSFGQPAPAALPEANGSGPDVAGTEQASAVLVRLFPGQIPLGGGELQTAVRQLCDPASRHELCFLLGYASAMMTAARPGPGPGARDDAPRESKDER